ncbi:CHAT domain-containing protein [Janthinobacterium sp. PLB04]|uniref:CHAT domain-containing protein n=1 Tax=Janthinobacterium lividum TaxID=29581 RepID=A0AAJ4T396_9BURK|nr:MULTISPECIES: CHAT domain-containing protein [Janthinobacterium]KAB0325102.1 CHAT domain-containing protein [Janthinobacterium lividum]QSX94191.1 CHAT domain-containing protein [Janthinobacterium lividum]UGQ33959.1 CHAT domain-containing protein [Janthinobacterium sp. PLB04]
MSISFDLFLLDGRDGNSLLALGRRGADTAIEQIAFNDTLDRLVHFGRRLGHSVSGSGRRPTPVELKNFGRELFSFIFPGSLQEMYDQLPAGQISLQILSDHPAIREVPWEYIAPHNVPIIPHRNRSVVRVHPTCGVYQPPRKRFSKLRILLVSADPIDQQGVPLDEVLSTMKRKFELFPGQVEVQVVAGATRKGLMATLMQGNFDVFHFYGHGEVDSNGVGSLVLEDAKTGRSDRVPALQLAVALAGKGIQLAILSACNTGAGNHANEFDVVSTALIKAGIPAVIANQHPIPTETIASFVSTVYVSLLNQGDIDMAVAEGRSSLAVTLEDTTASAVLEWGIPVLYRLSDARQLFEI